MTKPREDSGPSAGGGAAIPEGTNFLPTNPAALKHAFGTGGRSIVAGLRNFADDVLNNRGLPRQVDTTPFKVGRSVAVTLVGCRIGSITLLNTLIDYAELGPLGTFELAGRRLDLADIDHPGYIVAAVNDHIMPWSSSYATTRHVSGPVRFVLSGGGHIAGIVNPPAPNVWYMTSEDIYPTPEDWRGNAETHAASWWEDWAAWVVQQGGGMTDPPRLGSELHSALGDAPGEYVLG